MGRLALSVRCLTGCFTCCGLTFSSTIRLIIATFCLGVWIQDNTNKQTVTAPETLVSSSSPASHRVGVLWNDLLLFLADKDDNGPGGIFCVYAIQNIALD